MWRLTHFAIELQIRRWMKKWKIVYCKELLKSQDLVKSKYVHGRFGFVKWAPQWQNWCSVSFPALAVRRGGGLWYNRENVSKTKWWRCFHGPECCISWVVLWSEILIHFALPYVLLRSWTSSDVCLLVVPRKRLRHNDEERSWLAGQTNPFFQSSYYIMLLILFLSMVPVLF